MVTPLNTACTYRETAKNIMYYLLTVIIYIPKSMNNITTKCKKTRINNRLSVIYDRFLSCLDCCRRPDNIHNICHEFRNHPKRF